MIVGWETKTLGELCEFQRGLTYGKSDEVDVSSNVVLRANNVDLATHTLDLSDLRYISDSVSVPAIKKVRRGSLLICTASGSKSHLGKIAYVDDDYGYAFGGFMGQITPAPGVNDRYLFHALTSPAYKGFIEALSDGVNINNLRFDDLRQFPVPVPDLHAQRRIVAILDEAFEGIATAKANAEKSFENARSAVDAVRQETFARLAGSFGCVQLGAVCAFENGDRGKNYPGKQHRVAHGVPFINAGHLTEEGIDFGSMDYISPDRFALLGNGKIRRDDILFCLRGSLGKFASVGDLAEGAIASSLVILRPSKALAHDYLAAYLSSRQCADMIDRFKGGAAQPNLGATDLKKFELPLPPLPIQLDAAERLEELQVQTRSLERIYSAKLAALAELKSSLLQRAFTGALSEAR